MWEDMKEIVVRTNFNKKHLGGNIIGGDIDTYTPKLWDWAIEQFNVKSIIDIGCGEGDALTYFNNKGIEAFGIDGLKENIDVLLGKGLNGSVFDLTEGFYKASKKYDLVWCSELVEHVEEKYVDNIIKTFTNGKIVVMTHAPVGQTGYHHVNCKNDGYWIDLMEKTNFIYKKDLTEKAKSLNDGKYFVVSGLIFESRTT
jgi:2-polyprenyl-3-methyl-5-hydroxy-6-metoxy-1,4-benzoquinol methylase